jgi:hypothetical protein
MTATGLDAATLARLGEQARAAASPFIDPALYRAAEQLAHLASDAWLSEVLGRPVVLPAWRHLPNADLALMVTAIRADRPHLEQRLAEARAAHAARAEQSRAEAAALAEAERAGWAALAALIPVPVQVWHNWTARHLDGYEQGADHIVVLADLTAGRLSRPARHPLCWTPSRARELRHVTPNSGDERRLPDCKACLRLAGRFRLRPL